MTKILISLFFVLLPNFIASYHNHFDGRLNFECPPGEYVHRIESVHDNRREDRRWKFHCRAGFVTKTCRWSGYVNNWDARMHYICPGNDVIVGAHSYHDNGREDRRWKYKCCEVVAKTSNCRWSNWINGWDARMDKQLSHGEVIRGFYSVHDNGREDRVWRVLTCKMANCKAKKMNILTALQPTLESLRVVGIVSAQGCNPHHTYHTSLGYTDSVEETYSLSTTKGKTFTFNTEISVQAETSAKFLGTGGSLTFGVAQSFGGSTEMSKTTTKETSRGHGSSSGQTVEYGGPGAAMIVAHVKQYKFDRRNVDVEFHIECDDGSSFKERQKVNLKAVTYGSTHYIQKSGTYNKGSCTNTSDRCIRNLSGHKALQPYQLAAEFHKCVTSVGGTVYDELEK